MAGTRARELTFFFFFLADWYEELGSTGDFRGEPRSGQVAAGPGGAGSGRRGGAGGRRGTRPRAPRPGWYAAGSDAGGGVT